MKGNLMYQRVRLKYLIPIPRNRSTWFTDKRHDFESYHGNINVAFCELSSQTMKKLRQSD